MPPISVLDRERGRGRQLILVKSFMLHLQCSVVDDLMVSGLVSPSLRRERVQGQARVLLLLMEFFSSLLREVVLVLLLPLRHQSDVRSAAGLATPLGSVKTWR